VRNPERLRIHRKRCETFLRFTSITLIDSTMTFETFINQFPITEFLYSCAIIFAGLLIYVKTKSTRKFSAHKGMKYFSNTFLFFALAFIARLIFFVTHNYPNSAFANVILYQGLFIIVVEVLFMLAAFCLFLSLHYKQLRQYEHGIKYTAVFLFLVLAIIDYFYQQFLFMYIASTILFLFASIKSYKNHRKNNNRVSQVFFIATALLLIAWVLNFATQYALESLPILRWYVYTTNVVAVGIITAIVFTSLKEF
jgi:hypothetical protein